MSIHRGMERRCGAYITEYHSATKRDKTGSSVGMWMDLETVIQSEVSQKENNNTCMWTLEKWCRWSYVRSRNGDTDPENQNVDTTGKRTAGRDCEVVEKDADTRLPLRTQQMTNENIMQSIGNRTWCTAVIWWEWNLKGGDVCLWLIRQTNNTANQVSSKKWNLRDTFNGDVGTVHRDRDRDTYWQIKKLRQKEVK